MKPMMTESIFEDALQALKDRNLYRRLRTLRDFRGIHADLNGRDVILFCGNDYLGLSRHPRVKRAFQKAAESYGVGSGASRLISGGSDWHSKLEEKIAAFKKKEKALLFSSGYLANLGVLTALAGPADVIVLDKLCHASIIDGARLSGATLRVFPHRQYSQCESILKQCGKKYRKKILVSDTVFSMDGDLADLRELVRLRQAYGAILVVDDAHGTGVIGPEGRGAYDGMEIEDQLDVVVGTLSKAVGGLGGFAATSDVLADYLINHARAFIFATSLPPALCAAAFESFCVMEETPGLRGRLWNHMKSVHEALRGFGYTLSPMTSPIFPVMLGGEEKALDAGEYLLEHGILVPAIRYPAVSKGKARLRLTVNAMASEEDCARLLEAFQLMKSRVFTDKL